MKIKLPDRHDAAVLLGFAAIVLGIAQVVPWLAVVVAGAGLIYVGIFTEKPPEKR